MSDLVERVARAIAASKRGKLASPEKIDRVWPSYCGMARAAIAVVLDDLLPCYSPETIEMGVNENRITGQQ